MYLAIKHLSVKDTSVIGIVEAKGETFMRNEWLVQLISLVSAHQGNNLESVIIEAQQTNRTIV